MKKLSAISFQRSASDSLITHRASVITLMMLTAYFLLSSNPAWSADVVTTEVTGVACTIICLVQGIVGKMLAFIFLAAGAVSAFVGKWAYVAGGVGGGLLLIVGPRILAAAFTGPGVACTCN